MLPTDEELVDQVRLCPDMCEMVSSPGSVLEQHLCIRRARGWGESLPKGHRPAPLPAGQVQQSAPT